MMIWLDLKKLEDRLINREVTDKIAFTYLLFHLTYMSVLGHLGGDEDPIWAVWVHLFIALGVMMWGVSKTFEINQQGDNQDYFKRFLSLSFVAGLRCFLTVGLILVFLDLGIDLIDNSFFENSFYKTVRELVYFVCFMAYYYYRLLKSFRRINSESRGLEY